MKDNPLLIGLSILLAILLFTSYEKRQVVGSAPIPLDEVDIIGTRWFDYFKKPDGSLLRVEITEAEYWTRGQGPRDCKKTPMPNCKQAIIPTYIFEGKKLLWVKASGGRFKYDTVSGDLEYGQYAVKPDGKINVNEDGKVIEHEQDYLTKREEDKASTTIGSILNIFR